MSTPEPRPSSTEDLAAHRASRPVKIAYIAGNLTALAMVALMLAFCGYRIGFAVLRDTFRKVIQPSEEVLYLPKPILKELLGPQAVVDNADNATQQLAPYTMLVGPDPRLGWTLMPNALVSVYMLLF